MIKHFSYSQLNTFTKCQRQYEFRYIDKIPSTINGDLIRGDAYHKAIALAYSNIIIYKETPSIDEVLQVYSDTWNKRLQDKIVVDEGEELYIPSVDFKGKDPGKMYDDGVKLVRKYYSTILPKIIPAEVETKKTAVVNNVPLLSYIDLIDWGGTVIDHKVKSRMFSESELVKDLQSSFYGLVLGRDEFEFHFHTAMAVSEPYVKIIPIKRDRSDMEWIARLIATAWEQIQTGLFSPSTAGWWCSPSDCPYWSACHMPGGF